MGGYLLRTSNNNESVYGASPDLGMTTIAKGMTLQTAQTFDNFMTSELTNFLYASISNNFASGSDLASRNIQRGRDTGISSWYFYRKACTGSAPRNWSARPNDISKSNWAKLQSLYSSVQDIDLVTGSLAEDPLNGAVLGSTSACIVNEQFNRLVTGDRYFFLHGESIGAGFTQTQVNALRNVKLFDILCLNTNIASLQRNAFKPASLNGNPLVPCINAAGIDVRLFI